MFGTYRPEMAELSFDDGSPDLKVYTPNQQGMCVSHRSEGKVSECHPLRSENIPQCPQSQLHVQPRLDAQPRVL